jgi:hypothetical protein
MQLTAAKTTVTKPVGLINFSMAFGACLGGGVCSA